jgi:UDP-N-acetylmuramoylalanine--D-glutamate ligase
MVGAILAGANSKTVVAGNLRISALELLDRIDADTPVVLELSSWQLEALPPHRTSPHIAAITNISPDHLNRYRDLDDYADAKAIIFRYQQPDDFVVLNFDNRILTHLSSRAFSTVVWTSARHSLNQGACRDGEWLTWHWKGETQRILRVQDLGVIGAHNVENVLNAIGIAGVWGATSEQMAAALADWKGVPHRQELVRELDGVRYVNDTTATAPAAAIAAIQAFAPTAQAIVLIAGGADKALDMAEMARVIAQRVRRVVLLEGTATDKLEDAIRQAGSADMLAGRFDQLTLAVERARELAKPGDVVLLSPGCASFGMFANEFERGDAFRRVVVELA